MLLDWIGLIGKGKAEEDRMETGRVLIHSQRSRRLHSTGRVESLLARKDDLDGIFPLHELGPAYAQSSAIHVSHSIPSHLSHTVLIRHVWGKKILRLDSNSPQ